MQTPRITDGKAINGSAQKLTKVNFSRLVFNAMARKADYMNFYGQSFSNVQMNTL